MNSKNISIPKGAQNICFFDSALTCRPAEVMESLTRSVAAYYRADFNVKKLYIGIAS